MPDRKIIRTEELVEPSARRMLSDAQLEPNPELAAQGWERRFTADPQRAQEVIELYAQLGYEVRAESISVGEVAEDCEDCRSKTVIDFKTIYTRKK